MFTLRNTKLAHKLTTVGGRKLLQLQKNSPQVLTGLGIAGFVGTSILSARATLKLEPIIIDIAKDRQVAHDNNVGDAKALNRDLTLVYGQGVLKIARLYAPTVALALASTAAIVSAQGIQQKRLAGVAAAYATLDQGYKEYRERVEKIIGVEKERDIYNNIEKKDVEPTEKGELTKVRKAVHPGHISQYAVFFDQNNANWKGDPEYNKLFLRAQQNFANDMLVARGHVLLNDVYDMLGQERTKAGAVVGWVRGHGDDYIDFGVFNGEREAVREFVNGQEASILLDFNVDGVVYDLI